ncbi:hypothetical protein Csa_004940 [Cucumis sativus]|uniref:Uncharacterized protein n=1 Tax=Cucumis sativus TaxID=3659 RepID=A0A0A0KDE1_CUCSA|nr:hypothetical protein Csa_004940 [Cucumis sativus]
MVEVEEEQTLLPMYRRNEHKDQLPMNKKDVVIQVKNNLEKQLTELVLVDEFGSSGKTIKPSIYKIPKFMKDIQPNAYKPQLVLFGPYHHGDKDLVTMEQEKLKVFRHLVKGDAATYESDFE